MCACGLYIRVNDTAPKYTFIDHCHANASVNTQLKYFDANEKPALKTGDFPLIDCDSIIYNENDEDEWAKIPVFKDNFKCARLNLSSCLTFVVIN